MGRIRSTNQADAGLVYQVPRHADEVLQNWARWAAPRHGLKRRRNPLFALAKDDRWADHEADRTAPSGFAAAVDVDAAWVAEKVLCNPVFWPPARTLLQHHYLYRASERSICRLLAIAPAQYGHGLWRAACMFWNRYEQLQSKSLRSVDSPGGE